MADGVFTVNVVTPEERLLDVQARALVLRSSDGELTVLDGHTPLVTDVAPGDVRVDLEEGDPVHLAVHGGYLQVETGTGLDGEAEEGGTGERSTRATLLAGIAELADKIDVGRAERAKAEAETAVESLRAAGRSGSGSSGTGTEGDGTSSEDLELDRAEAALKRAEVRLEVAGAAS